MKKLILACVSCIALAGCDAGLRGGPKSSISTDRDFDAIIINSTLSPDRLALLARQAFVDANTRNAIIEARMAEIDVLYFQYESNISAEIRRGNFATSLLGILIGAAGAQAGASAAQNYAAAGGVVAGANAAYQKEVLLDQSLQAFVSQMRANRNRKKAEIVGKLTQPGTSYTLQAALSDLAEYRQAGTLASAVSGLTEKAQAEEVASEQTLQSNELRSLDERARTVRRPAPTQPSLARITGYIAAGPTDAEQRTRNENVNGCFETASVANKPASFTDYLLDADTFPALGTAIVTCLNTRHSAGL